MIFEWGQLGLAKCLRRKLCLPLREKTSSASRAANCISLSLNPMMEYQDTLPCMFAFWGPESLCFLVHVRLVALWIANATLTQSPTVKQMFKRLVLQHDFF